jgi:hypothetical protein
MYQLVLQLPAASMADYDAVVALEYLLIDGSATTRWTDTMLAGRRDEPVHLDPEPAWNP